MISRTGKDHAPNGVIRLDRVHVSDIFQRDIIVERVQDFWAVERHPRHSIFDLQRYDVSHSYAPMSSGSIAYNVPAPRVTGPSKAAACGRICSAKNRAVTILLR